MGGNMAQITVADAARRAGVQRSTIYRKAKKGGISLERGSDGSQRIDTAELYRVYPNASREPQPASAERQRSMQRIHQGGSGAEINQLRRELETSKQRAHDLEGDKTDLRTERDRLISIVESQTRQLEDFRGRPGFFRRVFGGSSAAALMIAVLLIGGTAWAQYEYKTFGLGIQSCGAWTAAKEEDSAARSRFHNWTNGYLTAVSRWVEYGSGPVNETQIEGAWAWIDNYCQKTPLNVVAEAAEALTFAIKAK